MSEFLLNMKESRPILEHFLSEFTKDIPKSNILFSKYNDNELEAKLVDVIENAINTNAQIWYEDIMESDDLFGDYEWTITCEKLNRGVFKDKDEFSCMVVLKSILRSLDNAEVYSYTERTYITCKYI